MSFLYKCDPNKNTECPKKYCVYNPQVEYKSCRHTTHEQFSVDGIPILAHCPHCGIPIGLTDEQIKELVERGKAVVECCGFFTIRNDGDGYFVR